MQAQIHGGWHVHGMTEVAAGECQAVSVAGPIVAGAVVGDQAAEKAAEKVEAAGVRAETPSHAGGSATHTDGR